MALSERFIKNYLKYYGIPIDTAFDSLKELKNQEKEIYIEVVEKPTLYPEAYRLSKLFIKDSSIIGFRNENNDLQGYKSGMYTFPPKLTIFHWAFYNLTWSIINITSR